MRILVADDDVTTRKILCFMLTKWGYEVIQCGNGDEAWSILNHPDRPRLAILDWNMPGLKGPSICRKVRLKQDKLNYVYLFILTARESKQDTVEGLAAGADDYLIKPIHAHELQTRLNTAKRVLNLQSSFQKELVLRKQAEGMLEELVHSLEDRVKARTQEISKLLNQKNRFVNQLGHDLKTPLTPLVALLPLVRQELEARQHREILDLAIENVGYIQSLVEHTIDLARLQAPGFKLVPKRTCCLELLDRIVASLQVSLQEAHLELTWNYRESCWIEVDPLQFRIAIENVISNAITFTPSGGIIELSLQNQDDKALFTIRDSGCGIEKEKLNLVFDEFYKADLSRHDRTSSGLGLSIVREIMLKHGGCVRIESPGCDKGTLVTLEFLKDWRPQ